MTPSLRAFLNSIFLGTFVVVLPLVGVLIVVSNADQLVRRIKYKK